MAINSDSTTFLLEWSTIGVISTIVTTISALTWWLSGQFNAVRNLVFTRVESTGKAILDKLEYHERHDDERFNNITKDLAAIQIRNAAKDTLMAAVMVKLDKMNGYGK